MEKKNWYGKYFNKNILNQNVDKFIRILEVDNKKLNLKDKLLLLEKKEPYEKTKTITKGVVVALSSEAKQKVIKSL